MKIYENKNYSNLDKEILNFWIKVEETAEEGKKELHLLINELFKVSCNTIKAPLLTDRFIKIFESATTNKQSSNIVIDKMIAELTRINENIHWYPNSIFKDQCDAEDSENYCANIIGLERESQNNPFLFKNDKVLVGLFLLGPNKFYPEHLHPACELWVILSGSARWKRGDELWKVKKPGDYFFHKSNESHAMETLDEPLLAIWAWTGDLDQWAEWKDNKNL